MKNASGRLHLTGDLVRFKLWQPEGFSGSRYRAEVWSVPQAKRLDRQVSIVWQSTEPRPEVGSFALGRNLATLEQSKMIAPVEVRHSPSFHVLELYAGGVGGLEFSAGSCPPLP